MSSSSGGTSSPRSATGSTSSGSTRVAPARARRRSTARSTGDAAHLLAAVHDADQPRRRGLVRNDNRYSSAASAQRGVAAAAVTTADTARDMDWAATRSGSAADYLGFSYGTFLGATYASMFPDRYRALVLDGPLDADPYINQPLQSLRNSPPASSVRPGASCRRAQGTRRRASGFGGETRGSPRRAPGAGSTRHSAGWLGQTRFGGRRRRPRRTMIRALYSQANWPFLGQALAQLDAGGTAGPDARGSRRVLRSQSRRLVVARPPTATSRRGRSRSSTAARSERTCGAGRPGHGASTSTSGGTTATLELAYGLYPVRTDSP